MPDERGGEIQVTFLGNLQVLHLEPDDVLAITLQGAVSDDCARVLIRGCRKALGQPDRRIIVLEQGVTLAAIRTAATAESSGIASAEK